jgi:ATP-dependent RNA helicase HelY
MHSETVGKYVEIGNDTQAGIAAFLARYPFTIDPFQIEAMEHLVQDRSVLVAAPTGTGKTLVAEYAIWLAQQRNQRVIYTTPLKALSVMSMDKTRLAWLLAISSNIAAPLL